MSNDITLGNGRVVTHRPLSNGAREAYMLDGGSMSGAEWDDYCAQLAAANAAQTRDAKLRRHAESRAAYLRAKAGA